MNDTTANSTSKPEGGGEFAVAQPETEILTGNVDQQSIVANNKGESIGRQ